MIPQPFDRTVFSMTHRHLCVTMLSADLRTTQTHHSATTTIPSDPPTTHHGHFLPDNPMPYMAPSVTHQPELLLLNWMICTITTLTDDLQHHPIVQDPIPPMSSFTNTPAYRLFLQLRNTLRHLINTTYEAQCNLYLAPQALLDTIAWIPRFPPHHTKPTSSPMPHHHTPQPSRHPLTHHLSSASSVAGIDLAPVIASLSPHLHIRTSQHTQDKPPPTIPQPPMAIVDNYIEHSGRLLPPQLPTAWLLACHHPSPEEAPATFCFTPHFLLRTKHKHPCDA